MEGISLTPKPHPDTPRPLHGSLTCVSTTCVSTWMRWHDQRAIRAIVEVRHDSLGLVLAAIHLHTSHHHLVSGAGRCGQAARPRRMAEGAMGRGDHFLPLARRAGLSRHTARKSDGASASTEHAGHAAISHATGRTPTGA